MANNNVIIDSIGLDMDGVLVDLASYQFKTAIPYFSKKLKQQPKEIIKDKSAYDIEEIFGVTHEERMKFWTLFIWKYCLSEKPRENVSKLTHKWHKEGRKVYIITSRVYVMNDNLLGELFRKMVYYWLDKNNIYYDDVIFCSEKNCAIDKTNACQKVGVKLMVDDKIENINMVSENSIALCYDNPWNQEGLEEKETIAKVASFEEIDEFIRKYEILNSKRYINLTDYRKSVK